MANRLASATSPYLLQHALNPVDWWEWGPEAFAEAKRRDAPILLSVGYSACHWCHVMAHESFEDEATAGQLNAEFVCVKVDREERPDVDAVYMEATVAMTGHGGWPMTVVLDHDGSPFFAGTYFPDRPRGGQPALRQVLTALTEAWRDRPDDVRRAAGTVREHLAREATLTGPPLASEDLDAVVTLMASEFDDVHGGFGGAPKFPPSMVLELLRRRTDDSSQRMLDRTLEAMARGGIQDQLAGGFARYSVDAGWVVPHFEKMLYDNAQLVGLYARWGTPLGGRVAADTGDWMLAELRTAEGGFASALDADSEGEEGRFYVWTPQQMVDVLGREDGRWAAEVFEVTGTFEHGTSTLQLLRDPGDDDRFDDVRRRLLAAREERVRPERDDKVVAAWNGLAIS
ncbi:MAG TPA: thioredoxin domain-containing protein, partial [Pedococcus sp.]|nr:thioredoxin domain-containing protein [Pedococcus sp.]